MKKSILITIVLVMSFSTLFGQSLDSYKYILIPNQYEFQKRQDQYQVNSLVKFLFNRAGYTAFLVSDELPNDLKMDNCLAAKAYVDVIPSMLSIKTVVRLEDCFGKTILVTKEERSKEKAYQKAYHESIRKTFVEIESLTYNYKPKNKETGEVEKIVKPSVIVIPKEIEKEVLIKEKIAEIKKEKEGIKAEVGGKEEKENKIKEIKKIKSTKKKKLVSLKKKLK